jgi:caffeoyl-CoA O-methyltransferase
MARGLPADGRVLTHEIDEQHAAFARRWIDGSDQKGKIDVRVGDARTTLAAIADGSADAVFLDADKSGYVGYLKQAVRLLRPGGVVLADNVLASGHVADGTTETAVAINAFLDAAAATDGLDGVIVPLGDGCYFGVKA